MTAICYHNPNANPSWIGYPVLADGSTLWVRFEGSSEAEVSARATAFLNAETQQQKLIAGNSDDGSLQGRGTGFIGKIWVLNRETGHRARVVSSEWASYQAKGYVQAGPRSS